MTAMRYNIKRGRFIGWKKAYIRNGVESVIIKLEIPASADVIRSKADGNMSGGPYNRPKLRASHVKVLGIYDMNMKPIKNKSARSGWNDDFIYRVGKLKKVSYFETDHHVLCGAGIHFYTSQIGALEH